MPWIAKSPLHTVQCFGGMLDLQPGREQTLGVPGWTAALVSACFAHHAAHRGSSAAASPAEGTRRLPRTAGGHNISLIT